MENSETQTLTHDCIYEDMSFGSPRTLDEGYMTSSAGCLTSSSASTITAPRARHGRSTLTPNPTLYINMNKPAPAVSREVPRDTQEVHTPANYEYIDIEIQERSPTEPMPPQLPLRNKNSDKTPLKVLHRMTSREGASIPRERLNVGLKSYQEQVRLEKELLVNFSAAVLDSNSSEAMPGAGRTFMNSAV